MRGLRCEAAWGGASRGEGLKEIINTVSAEQPGEENMEMCRETPGPAVPLMSTRCSDPACSHV